MENTVDVDGDPLSYTFELDTVNTFDGPEDIYAWEVSSLPEGSYWITAKIADATSSNSAKAPGTVTIDRTPPAVQAAPSGGTYTAAQSVPLTASEPATIYYTLDGSTPTAGSPQYTEPIDLSQTATVSFFTVDRAGNASPVQSQIYTIAATATQFWLFGYGTVRPQPQGYMARFAFLAEGPSRPGGWITYYCAKSKVDLASSRITAVAVSGHSVTLSGAGWVAGVPGSAFTATLTDGNPGRFGITIHKPDGSF